MNIAHEPSFEIDRQERMFDAAMDGGGMTANEAREAIYGPDSEPVILPDMNKLPQTMPVADPVVIRSAVEVAEIARANGARASRLNPGQVRAQAMARQLRLAAQTLEQQQSA